MSWRLKEPSKTSTRRWFGGLSWVFAFGLLLPACGFGAASPAEIKAYDVALRSFQTDAFDLAERELAEFLKNHPTSEKLPEAILLQAQCRYQQKRYQPALSLLRENLGGAAGLADQYRYWIGESLFQLGNYSDAAAAFSELLGDFPNSPRRLDASVSEALAWFRQGDLRRALDLLGRPDGAFQESAQSNPDSELTARGYLLLAEVCLGLKEFQAGEEALGRLTERRLRPELLWQQQYLRARLQLAGQQLDASLQTLTALLLQLGSVTNPPARRLQSDVITLLGELF